MSYRILRLPAVLTASGVSRSTLYQLVAQRLWTKPVQLGVRAVGWPESEVSALIAARISSTTPSSIRSLVTRLEAERKHAK